MDRPTDAPSREARRRWLAGETTAKRRLIADRGARWLVTAGGMAIIASILGILVFILLEVVPLLRPARVSLARSLEAAGGARALAVDEYQESGVLLGEDGRVRVLGLPTGKVLAETSLLESVPALGTEGPPRIASVALRPGDRALAGATSDGRLVVRPFSFEPHFDAAGARTVEASVGAPLVLELDEQHRPLGAWSVHLSGTEKLAAAAQLADGRLVVMTREATRNAFTGEVEESSDRHELAAAPPLSRLLLDQEGANLFAGSAAGELYWWRLGSAEETAPQKVAAGAAITALAFLIGDRSLVVGQQSGALSVWFPLRQGDDSFRLARIHDFPAHAAAITELAPSARNRSFLAIDAQGGLGLYYSTSERTLWQGKSPVGAPAAIAFSPKGDGAWLAGERELAGLSIDNPHPEISWKALFGKVAYEGYERPSYSWQSSGGSDDFEPKLSLTPLVVGTLKGTFYSLLLAIPLGVLGALFASQFLHPRLLGYIKPTVEIMAALPSVVLGFLAGLWLAPLLERTFPALILGVVLLPLAVWLAGVAWGQVPLARRNRWPSGVEVFLYLVVVAFTLWLCGALSPAFERLAFGGSFPSWLLATTGLRYDQRNAVVVGLAMGFAVIPIIFAIAEDALANVPKNLVAGSLALGANRWQTVTRVVLPTASPGIFSAVMIGFGRAVGETMIVLMATGNTPILDLSAFNGFRTLSANIAVEIPEAPHGGTLYRTLFLAALLLFLITFAVNTLAELVRQRLRRRYAQL
ncbi:MAG: ABC transporter permease subunit [Thermoanaerobaculia bacterium]